MSRISRRIQNKNEAPRRSQGRPVTMRLLTLALPLVFIAGVVVAQKDSNRGALAKDASSAFQRQREPTYAVQIPRGSNGEFAVQARINGTPAAMVVDTGATSVVLTYETAKAVGLPLEMLEYNIYVQTDGGHT